MSNDITCSIEGCDRDNRLTRGFCHTHYEFARRNGQLDAAPRADRRTVKIKECAACGVSFRPTSNRQKSCSKECKFVLLRKGERDCCNPDCDRKTSNGNHCSRCAARIYRTGTLKVLPKTRREIVAPDGYVRVFVGIGDPDANATGYAYVHRLVMSQHIGRPLKEFENVHHKNGFRHDNSLENLELWAKPQVPGQRVDDLIAFVVKNYPDRVRSALENERGQNDS